MMDCEVFAFFNDMPICKNEAVITHSEASTCYCILL